MNELHPLALGEIIDRSAAFWRGHVKPLFGLFLGFQLVQFTVYKAWEIVIQTYFPAMAGGNQALELANSDPKQALVQVGVGTGGALLLMVFTFFVSQVSGVAATQFVYPRVVGQGRPTVNEGLKAALARLGTTTGAFALAMLWSLVIAALLLAPSGALFALAAVAAVKSSGASVVLALTGMLAFFVGFLATGLWFIIRFILLSQVIALEDLGPLGTFRRTGQLSSGRIGPGFLGLVKVRLTLLITVVGAIVVLASIVSGIPQLVVQAVYGNVFDPMHANPSAVPQALLVPAQLLQIVVGSLVSPLYVVLQVMFYVDMRVRREGLDLALKLERSAP